ncbi:hypothetical protein D5081_20440 [Pectobacterium carotovorum]|nr:hypothetical protein D5081_20440 [Pectobacterium carotovorum]RJL37507.1 hypothetical protein D5083_18990 [Pectobacterium carotovorum]
MFCSTVNGRMGIVMNVVMTKAGILRHVGQLTSKNYAISVKASRDVRIVWQKKPAFAISVKKEVRRV